MLGEPSHSGESVFLSLSFLSVLILIITKHKTEAQVGETLGELSFDWISLELSEAGHFVSSVPTAAMWETAEIDAWEGHPK